MVAGKLFRAKIPHSRAPVFRAARVSWYIAASARAWRERGVSLGSRDCLPVSSSRTSMSACSIARGDDHPAKKKRRTTNALALPQQRSKDGDHRVERTSGPSTVNGAIREPLLKQTLPGVRTGIDTPWKAGCRRNLCGGSSVAPLRQAAIAEENPRNLLEKKA